MQNLNIALVQSELYWENIEANLNNLEETFWGNQKKLQDCDLIILPEMFNTGFSMDAAKLAEPMNFTTFRWLTQMAAQQKATIMGSFIVKEAGAYYNRLILMRPDGSFEQYDKRHLFRMANEHHHFAGGSQKLIFEINGWKICPMVCYDLRFPVWSRNTQENPYDCLIYIANWPARRASAWNGLLPARAIENLCYTVGVNRIGKDGNAIEYAGDSKVCDYLGNNLLDLKSEAKVEVFSLNKEKLIAYREKFPAHLDQDQFTIQ
ncbi:MAG: amidohydrolase [Flammeovirgaceae bacterium]|nr:amidohydrolase [Flammeovirgaceae bacterium]